MKPSLLSLFASVFSGFFPILYTLYIYNHRYAVVVDETVAAGNEAGKEGQKEDGNEQEQHRVDRGAGRNCRRRFAVFMDLATTLGDA